MHKKNYTKTYNCEIESEEVKSNLQFLIKSIEYFISEFETRIIGLMISQMDVRLISEKKFEHDH